MESEFERALRFVRDGKETSTIDDAIKLKLYGLFKRCTVGKCSEVGGRRPFFLNKIAYPLLIFALLLFLIRFLFMIGTVFISILSF